jgi:hypothetical protein
MDGGRRRRKRSADDNDKDLARAAWYAWWRSARFAAHFGGRSRLHPDRYAPCGPLARRWAGPPSDMRSACG